MYFGPLRYFPSPLVCTYLMASLSRTEQKHSSMPPRQEEAGRHMVRQLTRQQSWAWAPGSVSPVYVENWQETSPEAFLEARRGCCKTHSPKSGVFLQDWEGTVRVAEYSHFALADEMNSYRLFVGNYSGDVGKDALTYHNNTAFSTKDKDNDNCLDKCAELRKGEFWGRQGEGVLRSWGGSPGSGTGMSVTHIPNASWLGCFLADHTSSFLTHATLFLCRRVLVQLLHGFQPQRCVLPPWRAQQAPRWHHLVWLARLALLP